MSTLHATKQPCAKCPFRKDVPIYLRTSRRQQIANSLLDQQWFPCHATVTRDEDGDSTGDGLECAGAIKALALVGGSTQMSRIAERLGVIDLDAQVESGPDVWDLNTWMTLAEGATGDDPQVDEEEGEVETCSVSYSGCRAPAGYLGSGGAVVRGTTAADGTCEACGDPVCSNCRHGEDGPCFNCLDEDEGWDGRSIV